VGFPFSDPHRFFYLFELCAGLMPSSSSWIYRIAIVVKLIRMNCHPVISIGPMSIGIEREMSRIVMRSSMRERCVMMGSLLLTFLRDQSFRWFSLHRYKETPLKMLCMIVKRRRGTRLFLVNSLFTFFFHILEEGILLRL
jgi:hypothetical protein